MSPTISPCAPFTLDVEIDQPLWTALIEDAEGLATRILAAAAKAAAAAASKGEAATPRPAASAMASLTALTLVLTSDSAIHRLNRNFRGQDKPTNVLAFATPVPPAPGTPDASGTSDAFAGDIFIAAETVRREAADQNKTVTDHTIHLIVHGFLHLIGYDHEEEADARAMEALEITILKALGIKNPYIPIKPDIEGEISTE